MRSTSTATSFARSEMVAAAKKTALLSSPNLLLCDFSSLRCNVVHIIYSINKLAPFHLRRPCAAMRLWNHRKYTIDNNIHARYCRWTEAVSFCKCHKKPETQTQTLAANTPQTTKSNGNINGVVCRPIRLRNAAFASSVTIFWLADALFSVRCFLTPFLFGISIFGFYYVI